MGVRFPSVQTNTILNATVATTVETLIATTPPFTPPIDFSTIIIMYYLALAAGTAATAISIRLRRGTAATGTLVQATAVNDNIQTALPVTRGAFYFDNPGAVTGQQYSMTVQQSAATGNGTVSDLAMFAFAL